MMTWLEMRKEFGEELYRAIRTLRKKRKTGSDCQIEKEKS